MICTGYPYSTHKDNDADNTELSELGAAYQANNGEIGQRQETLDQQVSMNNLVEVTGTLPKPKPIMFPALVIRPCHALAALSWLGGVTSSKRLRREACNPFNAKSKT